jgi:hypothetical protein
VEDIMKIKGLVLTVCLLGSVTAQAQLLGSAGLGIRRASDALKALKISRANNYETSVREFVSLKASVPQALRAERTSDSGKAVSSIYVKEAGVFRTMTTTEDVVKQTAFVIPEKAGTKVVGITNGAIHRRSTLFKRLVTSSEGYRTENLGNVPLRVKKFEHGYADEFDKLNFNPLSKRNAPYPFQDVKGFNYSVDLYPGGRGLFAKFAQFEAKVELPKNFQGKIFHFETKFDRSSRLPKLVLWTNAGKNSRQIEVPMEVTHDGTLYANWQRASFEPLAEEKLILAFAQQSTVKAVMAQERTSTGVKFRRITDADRAY